MRCTGSTIEVNSTDRENTVIELLTSTIKSILVQADAVMQENIFLHPKDATDMRATSFLSEMDKDEES